MKVFVRQRLRAISVSARVLLVPVPVPQINGDFPLGISLVRGVGGGCRHESTGRTRSRYFWTNLSPWAGLHGLGPQGHSHPSAGSSPRGPPSRRFDRGRTTSGQVAAGREGEGSARASADPSDRNGPSGPRREMVHEVTGVKVLSLQAAQRPEAAKRSASNL
jgi:hypothetical protein